VSGEPARPGPVSEPGPITLVPPYPIFGPEALDERLSVQSWPLVLAFVLAAGGALWLARIWLMRRLRSGRGASVEGPVGQSAGHEYSTRDRVVACSATLRDALVARYGDGWRAKTTQEIESTLIPGDGLDEVFVAGLIRFLFVADLAKFGGEWFGTHLDQHHAQRDLTDPEAWCATLVAGLAAGARSTISGK
jgi:hypothetical protein